MTEDGSRHFCSNWCLYFRLKETLIFWIVFRHFKFSQCIQNDVSRQRIILQDMLFTVLIHLKIGWDFSRFPLDKRCFHFLVRFKAPINCAGAVWKHSFISTVRSTVHTNQSRKQCFSYCKRKIIKSILRFQKRSSLQSFICFFLGEGLSQKILSFYRY